MEKETMKEGMYQGKALEIHGNNAAYSDWPCCICGEGFTYQVPLSIGIRGEADGGDWGEVCPKCARQYAPELQKLLDMFYSDSEKVKEYAIAMEEAEHMKKTRYTAGSDPKQQQQEAERLEQALSTKVELLAHYRGREPKEFLQIDVFADMQDSDDPIMIPDIDGDCMFTGKTTELMQGSTIRVFVEPGIRATEFVRLMYKIVERVTGDMRELEELIVDDYIPF